MMEISPVATSDVAQRHATASRDQHAAGWLLGFTSANTRDAYSRDLRAWFAFCDAHEVDVYSARRAHVSAWARTLEAAGKKPRTVARSISSVASWYRYLVIEEVIEASPTEHVKRPKLPMEGSTPGLSLDELRRFLAAAESRGPTEHALMMLLSHTGLRINEALSCDVESVSQDSGHKILRFYRKGNTEASTVLTAPVVRAIEAMLKGRETGPLFEWKGRRLREIQAWNWVRSIARSAGIGSANGLCPHSLRVTFATEALDAGVPIGRVQHAMGHVRADTTFAYDRKRGSLDRHASHAVTLWISAD